jgi:hypothetical protein
MEKENTMFNNLNLENKQKGGEKGVCKNLSNGVFTFDNLGEGNLYYNPKTLTPKLSISIHLCLNSSIIIWILSSKCVETQFLCCWSQF